MSMFSPGSLKLAANLSWLYTEHAFLDRFGAAAADGFPGVECLFPHEHPASEVFARLKHTGLSLVLFNAEAGDWAAGERGLACLPGRQQAFERSVASALSLAQRLGCPRVHVMAGISQGLLSGDAELLAQESACYAERMAWAAEQAQQAGVTVMVEPINPIDMPGYLLQRQSQAHALVQQIGSAHLQVQMDLYHCQRVEGQALSLLQQYLPTGRVGHLQIASVPYRDEPWGGLQAGDLNCDTVFDCLYALGYTGWIGCEYRPHDTSAGGTSRGLGWRRTATMPASTPPVHLPIIPPDHQPPLGAA